jgi:hypothetical protein
MKNNKFIKYFLIFSILILSSCGFQIIYKDQTTQDSIAHQLASIRIKKNRNQLDVMLKSNLYDIFNPDNIKAEPRYFLEFTTKKNLNLIVTTPSGATGRNKVNLTVNYVLRNLENGLEISSGTDSVYDSYDITENRYGTFTAEEFVIKNLTKVISQNIRNSLINDIINASQECEKNKNNTYFRCLIIN